MPKPHDFAVFGFGRDFEAIGEAFPFYCQGMVAHGLERLVDSLEYAFSVGCDRRGLSMHEPLGGNHFSPERVPDGLVAEADSQDRYFSGAALDQGNRDSGRLGSSGARRNHDSSDIPVFNVLCLDGVVSDHFHIRAYLAQMLNEVVGKGIVVVDHQNHFVSPCDE